MNRLLLFVRKTWRVLFFLNGAMVFFILFPAIYISLLRESWFPFAFRLKKTVARFMIFNTGISYRVHFKGTLDRKKPYVYCPNHTSFLDIILSYLVIPQYFHFVAKGELKKVPLFNVFFRRMDIAFDRGSLRDSHRAFVRAASDIDKGISIAIFPEATIPEHAPRLRHFKNGPFRLAIDKQVPIVPVTFKNNWRILPDGRKGKKGGRPGRAEIIIHAPVETTGMGENDVSLLRSRVFEVIDAELRKDPV